MASFAPCPTHISDQVGSLPHRQYFGHGIRRVEAIRYRSVTVETTGRYNNTRVKEACVVGSTTLRSDYTFERRPLEADLPNGATECTDVSLVRWERTSHWAI